MEKKLITKYKKKLTSSRTEIEDLSASSLDDRKPVKLDQSSVGRLSRIDALQLQAMNLEIERRRAREINLIDAALTRIVKGTYGVCPSCGEHIDIKRLDVNPTTLYCYACSNR